MSILHQMRIQEISMLLCSLICALSARENGWNAGLNRPLNSKEKKNKK